MDLAKVMGFSGFGGSTKAKYFDLNQMVAESKGVARERNAERNAALEDEAKKAEADPQPGPSGEGEEPSAGNANDEDDDVVGPPLPSSMSQNEKKKTQANNSDEDLDDDDDEEETLDQRIPKSHEVQLNHGSKAISGTKSFLIHEDQCFHFVHFSHGH